MKLSHLVANLFLELNELGARMKALKAESRR
jgi:hypothetical protein